MRATAALFNLRMKTFDHIRCSVCLPNWMSIFVYVCVYINYTTNSYMKKRKRMHHSKNKIKSTWADCTSTNESKKKNHILYCYCLIQFSFFLLLLPLSRCCCCCYTTKITTHNNSQWHQRHHSISRWTIRTFGADLFFTRSFICSLSFLIACFHSLSQSLCDVLQSIDLNSFICKTTTANQLSRMIDSFQWAVEMRLRLSI